MTLPSGLPDIVGDEEDIARFLTSSSQYNSISVKQSAFLPSPKDGKKSVFRHGVEPLEELKQLGEDYVNGNLYGAAIIKAKKIRDERLDVVSEEPPPRHADIIDWIWRQDDPLYGKAENKEKAIALAQAATRHLFV